MDKDYSRYFKILELPSNASLYEVKKAYNHLRNLYSTESMVTLPIEEEYSSEDNKKILEEIEEAYQNLLKLFQEHDSFQETDTRPELSRSDTETLISNITNFDGQTLKKIREGLNIDLHEISMTTKVTRRHLENIEIENFHELPNRTYTRGFVLSYIKYLEQYLELDPYRATESYMEKFNRWQEPNEGNNER